MSESGVMQVVGYVYIGDGGPDYWAEHQSARVEIQRTEDNEIRIGVLLPDSDSDDATIYLTLDEASRLTHSLGIAILAHEAAAYEAAKYEGRQ